MINKTARILFAWPRALRRGAVRPGNVVYYPAFGTRSAFDNHYHRARWYLPAVSGVLSRVSFFQRFSRGPVFAGERPNCMAQDLGSDAHFDVRRSGMLGSLWRAQVILAWKNPRWMPLIWLMRLCGATVLNVTTDDATAREYGAYCKIVWSNLMSVADRDAVLAENRERFMRVAKQVRRKNSAQACVMGNGPTLEHALEFDLANTLVILCNTTVGDDRIMSHATPAFVCASDVVSHLGVSAPAGAFRRMLFSAMPRYEFTFVTTAAFGYLLSLHYPQYRERIVLIDQACDDPVYDLAESFRSPKLDSVMNILMLPLAATFCTDIWLLGADGKSTSRDNEDFWAHATTSAADADLVKAGHFCHPTFDLHRQQTTYRRYNESIERTVTIGETQHGKRYRCLFSSNTPVLTSRVIPEAWRETCRPDNPCSLDALTERARGFAVE